MTAGRPPTTGEQRRTISTLIPVLVRPAGRRCSPREYEIEVSNTRDKYCTVRRRGSHEVKFYVHGTRNDHQGNRAFVHSVSVLHNGNDGLTYVALTQPKYTAGIRIGPRQSRNDYLRVIRGQNKRISCMAALKYETYYWPLFGERRAQASSTCHLYRPYERGAPAPSEKRYTYVRNTSSGLAKESQQRDSTYRRMSSSVPYNFSFH
jgi:hypothetical protein